MTDRWRDLLDHDGLVVVRLRLLTSGEGGRDRAIQSGFRATWLLPGRTRPDEGPIDLVGGRRSIRPGEEAVVQVHPMAPERWQGLAPGDRLDLWWGPGRRLGTGVVERIVDLPDHPVPLRPLPSSRDHAVMLTRRGWFRRRARTV